MRAWLVGGAVRDLLLHLPTSDLDLVVGGDAGELADAIGARHGIRPRRHDRFGTATLELPEGVRLDLARPRRETYAHNGALPRVEFPATLEEDLFRRDFAIHAMALPLSGAGGLVDPFGGRSDLAARRLRVLHPRSFLDDPTRAYRAVRYAARLGFRIEAAAVRLLREAVAAGAFDAVSGDRLRRECALILAESGRVRSAALMARLGLDRVIAPSLARPGAAARLRAAESAARRLGVERLEPLCYLLAWMGDAPQRSLAETADRLALAGAARETWLGWRRTRGLARGIASLSGAARIRRARGVPREIAAAVAATLPARDRAAWVAAVRAPRPELSIRGRDLIAAGVPPGPAVGEALARTLAAREEGRIGPDRELDFALAAALRRERS
jgi:tRNA nucleotidyltransferase (CCA-adding enzyme)